MWIVTVRTCRCLLRKMSGDQFDHARVVTVMAKLRHGSGQIRLGREFPGTSFTMAVRAVLSWFMNVPGGRLPRLIGLLRVGIEKVGLKRNLSQWRHAVEEIIQNFMTLNFVTTSDEDD